MDLRLAYRIISDGPVFRVPPDIDLGALKHRLTAMAGVLPKVPHFIFDNVAEFYAGSPQGMWDMANDIPNMAPPFGVFWVEWNEPRRWRMPEGDRLSPCDSQCGMLVTSFHITDANRGKQKEFLQLMSMMMGFQPGQCKLDDLADSSVKKGFAEASWMLACEAWFTASSAPLCGRPFWMGTTNFVFVAPSGRPIASVTSGVCAGQYEADHVMSPLHILGLGLSFCHCKNVERVENDGDRGERWHRREGVPAIKFYTLDIVPMRKVLVSEGGLGDGTMTRALHICRGHFANYTPEHPLFGKYVGTYWRPDHVRGRPENGQVHKRYDVNQPLGS